VCLQIVLDNSGSHWNTG